MFCLRETASESPRTSRRNDAVEPSRVIGRVHIDVLVEATAVRRRGADGLPTDDRIEVRGGLNFVSQAPLAQALDLLGAIGRIASDRANGRRRVDARNDHIVACSALV